MSRISHTEEERLKAIGAKMVIQTQDTPSSLPSSSGYASFDGVQLYCGDCNQILHKLSGVDYVITDPPYGVELSAKRASVRGGGTTVRPGHYDHEDSPAYVQRVVVPAIGMCIIIAQGVVVTPGTRNLHLYPIPDDMGCFFSGAGTGMGRWGFTCMQPILYYGKDPPIWCAVWEAVRTRAGRHGQMMRTSKTIRARSRLQ
jgi:hypothetical protein